jgi:hypothetical protein
MTRDSLIFVVILSRIIVVMFALFFWSALTAVKREAEEDWGR